MMPGMGFETSLVEVGTVLLKWLLILVLISVVAAVLTLPVFYGALAFKVAWFWACAGANAV